MIRPIHFIVGIVLLFLPGVAVAQAPVLGTASSFVLFSSTGAVGNTGVTSHFTGNIGTLSGAITIGVNVNGVLHNADAAAIAATADVLLAYQQLQATPPTDTQFSVGSYALGNQDTLVAGVDSITNNTVLTDTLVLNGQNNANAVFIFKINGTFTSTNALVPPAIVLINGALACNVFFQVNNSVNIAAGSSIKGTIITNSAAINLSSGTTLEGRALTATAGAITTTNVLTYLPTGCGSPVLNGPSAPVLGAVSCYALFTSSGANTNSGVTNVTGDVGSNLGLTTGYNSLLVNGAIHSSPDGSTSAAASALGTVSTYLNNLGLVPDIELQFPAQFGNDLVLTPHIYLMSAATSLTGNIYLNAEGNANAVFVIKVLGAFSASAGSAVVLINGTQSKNVFWIINGALSMAGNAVMKGTFVVATGAISMGTSVNLDGRALTTNGLFTANAVTATIPPLTCSAVPLPISWLYFRGQALQQSVLLEWGTTHEMNNGFFTVEKSRDGLKFDFLTTVNAVTDAGNAENHYTSTDAQPYGLTYYRIAQTDNNGHKTVFNTIRVNASAATGFTTLVYQQGAFINVRCTDAGTGDGTLMLYSIEGKKHASQPIVLSKESMIYQIERPSQSGIYIVYIESQGIKRYAGKVFVD